MRLIVDTNRIIAALIKNGASRRILLSNKFELLTLDFTKSELEKHKKAVLHKARITDAELEKLLSLFFKRIYVVEDIVVKEKYESARRIMDKIDPDDTPFIALALSVENDGIWSDDKHFGKQNVIGTWKTSDLLALL